MKKRLTSLDGLRGIACFIIAFLWHYLNMQSQSDGLPFEKIFYYFYTYGQYFVELFFMLSGFVMAYAYKEKIEAEMSFSTYIYKRYQHLYPLMILTLIITALLQFTFHFLTGDYYIYKCDFLHFILNIFCIQTGWISNDQSFNGPAWCISVEIFCYICFFFVCKYSRKSTSKYCGISFATILISLYVIVRQLQYPFFNVFMARGVCCFFLGVLLQEFHQNTEHSTKLKIIYGLSIQALLYVLLCVIDHIPILLNETDVQLVFILFISPLSILISINFRPISSLLNCKLFQYCGKISMDIYLWHIPVQILIKILNRYFNIGIDFSEKSIFFLYIFTVLGIASLSNYCMRSHKKRMVFSISLTFFALLFYIVLHIFETPIVTLYENDLNYHSDSHIKILSNGQSISQTLTLDEPVLLQNLSFYAITWDNQYDSSQTLSIKIENLCDNLVIYESNINCNNMTDGKVYTLLIDNLELQKEIPYSITLKTNINEAPPFAVLLTDHINNNMIGQLNEQEQVALRLTGQRIR